MRFLIKLLKGALIGISVVIPGVGGGSMAMSMGIYDQLIDFVTDRKNSFKHGRVLFPYILGMVIGVAAFSYFIELMFQSYPLQTACAFAGMILGALPMLLQRVKGQRFGLSHALLLLGMAVLMVLLSIESRSAGTVFTLAPDMPHALLAFGLGFVAAATMVIPGFSGSMLLILLGYYEPILTYVNGFTAALFSLGFAAMLQRMIILVPFSLGVLGGIFFMARIVRILLRRFPYATYYAIMGLVISSPFTVLYQQTGAADAMGWFLAVLAAMAGFVLAIVLGKGEA
jgi:putative membrane protein